MKNWKTTVLGLTAGVLMFLGQSGLKIGHVGNTDFFSLLAPVAVTALGAMSKDHDVTGGERPQ